MSNESKNKAPIQSLRDGAVVVKIWEQQGKNGPYPSATLGRTYKNEQTGEWGESQSLGRNDLLKAQALLMEANREMVKWQDYYKEQDRQNAPKENTLPGMEAEQKPAPAQATQPSNQGLAAQRDAALSNAIPPQQQTNGRSHTPEH